MEAERTKGVWRSLGIRRVAKCGNYDRQGDDQCALAAGVSSTARLCLHAAAADDLRESQRHLRIELLLMPWADATPTSRPPAAKPFERIADAVT